MKLLLAASRSAEMYASTLHDRSNPQRLQCSSQRLERSCFRRKLHAQKHPAPWMLSLASQRFEHTDPRNPKGHSPSLSSRSYLNKSINVHDFCFNLQAEEIAAWGWGESSSQLPWCMAHILQAASCDALSSAKQGADSNCITKIRSLLSTHPLNLTHRGQKKWRQRKDIRIHR